MRIFGYLVLSVLVGIIVLAMGYGLGWFGLAANRQMAPYAEETSRITTQRSIRRQEGVNQGVGELCLNMRLEREDASKRAFAHMIVTTATPNDQSILTAENRECRNEALGLIQSPSDQGSHQ